jgi:hypothetical protein
MKIKKSNSSSLSFRVPIIIGRGEEKRFSKTR